MNEIFDTVKLSFPLSFVASTLITCPNTCSYTSHVTSNMTYHFSGMKRYRINAEQISTLVEAMVKVKVTLARHDVLIAVFTDN